MSIEGKTFCDFVVDDIRTQRELNTEYFNSLNKYERIYYINNKFNKAETFAKRNGIKIVETKGGRSNGNN